MLHYVPKELITSEMCTIAVKSDGIALQYVPKEFITEEMCLKIVKGTTNHDIVEYVLKVAPELCKVAVEQNPDAEKFVRLDTN